jgi:hypothetical protein
LLLSRETTDYAALLFSTFIFYFDLSNNLFSPNKELPLDWANRPDIFDLLSNKEFDLLANNGMDGFLFIGDSYFFSIGDSYFLSN